jgi:hypothetical protein
MKYAGWTIVVVMLVGGGLSLFLANDGDAPQVTERQEMRTDTVQEAASVDKKPAGLPDQSAAQSAPEAPAVTQEQRAIAQQQEETILAMAREYDTVRADPQKRQVLRKEMQQALATYSEAVLPIAMEKMASAQSLN